jgi:lipopolysaccharide cholinephosphotransferase
MMMLAAMPLNISWLRSFFKYQIEKYNNKDTDYRMFFAGRYRFKTSFYHKSVLGKPQMVPFEDTYLPVPEKYDEWLTQIFGDYMTPPSVEQQIGLHLINVDFGKY